MTVPLSHYLTRFQAASPAPATAIEPAPVAFEPMLVLSQAELEARLAAATDAVRRDLLQNSEAETAAREAALATAHAEALAAARADWVSSQAEVLSAAVLAGLADLRTAITGEAEAVLRPFLVEAVRARAIAQLGDALDHLIADPTERVIRVRGPADLVAALRASCDAPSIEWTVGDGIDVTVTADATRIETRLAAAFAALDATET